MLGRSHRSHDSQHVCAYSQIPSTHHDSDKYHQPRSRRLLHSPHIHQRLVRSNRGMLVHMVHDRCYSHLLSTIGRRHTPNLDRIRHRCHVRHFQHSCYSHVHLVHGSCSHICNHIRHRSLSSLVRSSHRRTHILQPSFGGSWLHSSSKLPCLVRHRCGQSLHHQVRKSRLDHSR